ncbi:hypothetical protein KSD_68390 [Ktedonobacter sp. SOSP1-85]|nr:hypothetical protein KSD_68390 [Ktedonobacter sp. SOSP1-85]
MDEPASHICMILWMIEGMKSVGACSNDPQFLPRIVYDAGVTQSRQHHTLCEAPYVLGVRRDKSFPYVMVDEPGYAPELCATVAC